MQKMSEKEAIDIIKYASAFNRDNSPLTKALEVAITALEEIQQYRAIGTVEECREAREKQIPKKPHKYIAYDGIKRNGCPRCFEERGANEILYAGQKYCSVCGQRLDREE